MIKISPARKAAFDVLLRIERDQAFSSVLLPQFEEYLSQADRALCHELVLGVLRRAILLDRLIDAGAKGRKLDLEVRIALRLGLFQLLHLDKIPAHAAVNDSVNLVVRAKKSSARGLVNAILRKATDLRSELKFSDELDRISVETSHPAWLIEKWSHDFGRETAEKIAAANNVQPAISFRKTLKGRDLDLEDKYQQSSNVDGCFMAERFDVGLHQLSDDGLIYFQDEASQLVASAVKLRTDATFLDVCAAPGGKTGAIAFQNSEAVIVAGDVYWPRVAFLKESLLKQGVRPQNVVQYDAATTLPFENETFDAVLVDAPCSGTGTIRHNPEIRYFLDPKDFAGLQKTQLEILKNASKLVRPGGLLVYSTCSLEGEENEDVCERFLTEDSVFQSVVPQVPEKFVTDKGFARTFPQRDDMDGFFIAALMRR